MECLEESTQDSVLEAVLEIPLLNWAIRRKRTQSRATPWNAKEQKGGKSPYLYILLFFLCCFRKLRPMHIAVVISASRKNGFHVRFNVKKMLRDPTMDFPGGLGLGSQLLLA